MYIGSFVYFYLKMFVDIYKFLMTFYTHLAAHLFCQPPNVVAFYSL